MPSNPFLHPSLVAEFSNIIAFKPPAKSSTPLTLSAQLCSMFWPNTLSKIRATAVLNLVAFPRFCLCWWGGLTSRERTAPLHFESAARCHSSCSGSKCQNTKHKTQNTRCRHRCKAGFRLVPPGDDREPSLTPPTPDSWGGYWCILEIWAWFWILISITLF